MPIDPAPRFFIAAEWSRYVLAIYVHVPTIGSLAHQIGRR
jgi:hypothetical protein